MRRMVRFLALVTLLGLPAEAAEPDRLDETLASGARLILEARPGTGTFAFTLFTQGGSLEDPQELPGLTNVLSRILMRGGSRRTEEALTLQIESLGATAGPVSGPLGFGIQAEGPEAALHPVFEALADALLSPRFDPESVAREMQIARRSLAVSLESPPTRRIRAAQPILFAGHPLGRIALPDRYPGPITPRDLQRAHAARLGGRRLVFVAVGDFDLAALRGAAEVRFAGLPAGDGPPRPLPAPAPLDTARHVRVTGRFSQAELLVAIPTTGVAPNEESSLEVIERILGGYEERLSARIRGERGWAYWVESVGWRYPGAGMFGIATAVPKRRLAATEAIILEEWRRLAGTPITAEELDRIRLWLTTSAARRWQRASERAGTLAARAARGRPPESPREYAARLAAVTPEQVRELAARLFSYSPPVVIRLY